MLGALLLIVPSATFSQIIPIKTVPLATGNQFQLFPSSNLASGGISVAIDDPLLDPFVNPAKGAVHQGLRILSSPQYYSIALQEGGTNEGSGKTLPLGLFFKTEKYFGGLYWARQQLQSERQSFFGTMPTVGQAVGMSAPQDPENNTYTFGMVGTMIPGTDFSIAISALWGELNAVEGVKLLFPRSDRVNQNGTLGQYRIGFAGEFGDHERIDAVLVRSQFKMRYDVWTSSWGWRIGDWAPQVQFNSEYDETELWGVQVGYVRPLKESWHLGVNVTANWKTHPKIPNYELMNIPRDPGNSTAYNLGIGLASIRNEGFIGFDLIYEPIRTETWADAAAPITLPNGKVIPVGGKTVENFFNFSNWIARAGFRAGSEQRGFQLGLRLRVISYHLDQINHVEGFRRAQDESWNEWTASAGYGFTIGPLTVHYTGLLTMGTGQPGVESFRLFNTRAFAAADADFLPAPGGRLNLRDALVWSHMLSVSLRID